MSGIPKVSIVGLCGAIGSDTISLEQLSEHFRIPMEKIHEKTGISCLRRFSSKESLVGITSDVAMHVLKHCGIGLGDISGVYGSSNLTSETVVPSFAVTVAQRIGLRHVIADQIGLGCSGGIQALQAAYNQLVVDAMTGKTTYYLVVVGDHTSKVLNPDDPDTGILFGEGVSAFLVTNDQESNVGYEIIRIATKSLLEEDLDILKFESPYNSENVGILPSLEMRGRKVYRFGANIGRHILGLVDYNRLPENCYLIPHQANLRILIAMAKRSGLPIERMYVAGIKTIGNTSTPSVFLGLEDALRQELFDLDNQVLLGVFGAELQAGAVLLQPQNPKRMLI